MLFWIRGSRHGTICRTTSEEYEMAGKNPEAICIMDLDDSSSINKSSCSSSLASIAALPTAAKQMSTTNSTTLPPAINEVAHFLNDSDDDDGESMQIQLMPAALLAASGKKNLESEHMVTLLISRRSWRHRICVLKSITPFSSVWEKPLSPCRLMQLATFTLTN